MSDDLIGRTIGNYVVKRLVGSGGMGSVYLAEHARLGRPVAVKVLLPELSSDPTIVTRFFNEAQAASDIRNAHIVDVIDFGDIDPQKPGTPYLMMEWLEGRPLSLAMKEDGPFSVGRAARIAVGVCRALSAAHGHGVVHRDLKPDNVFLVHRDDNPEFVKVVDFGIAKLLQRSATSNQQTALNAVLGTPEYMSPEQCRGENATLDGRSDIYSLGIITYEMIAGRRPFDAANYVGNIVAHMSVAPLPLRELVPEVPAKVEAVVMRALAKARDERQASMNEFMNELVVAVGTTMAGPPTPESMLPRRTLAPAAGAPPAPARVTRAEPAGRPVARAEGPAVDASGQRPTWEPSKPRLVEGDTARLDVRGALDTPSAAAGEVEPRSGAASTAERTVVTPPRESMAPKVVLAVGVVALVAVLVVALFPRKPAPASPASPPAVATLSPAAAARGDAPAGTPPQAPPSPATAPSAAPPPPSPPVGARPRPPAAPTTRGAHPDLPGTARLPGAPAAPEAAPAPPSSPVATPVPPPAGASPPAPHRRDNEESLEGRLADESERLAPSGRRYGPALSGESLFGRPVVRAVPLEGGHCYTFVSVGTEAVIALHTVLADPTGAPIGDDPASINVSVFTACATTTGSYRFQARAARGSGHFKTAVLRSQ